MKENKAIGPNLKTYYYYTNKKAEEKNVKGIILIATGIEATGAVYDEIGDYLDTKGYAMYAIDELGYAKAAKMSKGFYKNWKSDSFYFVAYNVHSLSVLAKNNHPDAPVYLIGNDFGAMISLYLLREFQEVIDKVVTIGWGTPRGQDYGFFFTAWIKKLFLYDDGISKMSHKSKNKRFAFRFERGEKYAWLTSDAEQLKKIKDVGFINEAGTIGHYYHYYKQKIKTPLFMRLKKCDRSTPMLFVSGDEDLLTMRGKKTKALERFYKRRKFTNVSSLTVPGRHEILFEKNRFDNLEIILKWLNDGIPQENIAIQTKRDDVETVRFEKSNQHAEESYVVEKNVVDVKIENTPNTLNELQEAEDELLISTNKESE